MDSDHIPHGSLEMLRACIHEMAGLAALQAEMAMRYAEISDDVGLQYALRKWAAYTCQAIDAMGDLKAMQKGRFHERL